MLEIQSESNKSKERNTIILEFGSQKKDHIRDLQEGRGRLFKQIARTIAELKKTGEVGDSVQPVIVIVKRKKSKKGVWD